MITKRLGVFVVSIFIFSGFLASAQSPTGNDNQGGVAAPAGEYFGMPAAGPVLVNAYTANSTRIVTDLQVSYVGEIPLTWTRFCDTRATTGSTPFGPGGYWRDSFQWDFASTTVNGVAALQVIYPDGTENYFTQTSPNQWTSTSAVTDIITPNGTGYNLTNSSNQVYTFVPTTYAFQLSKITDSKGLVTNLTYGTYGLSKVTEPGGRYLTIVYSPYVSLVSTTTPGHPGTQVVGAGGGGATPQTGGTTTTSYAYYISSVTTSDGRYVNYSYGATSFHISNANQTGTLYHSYLSGATYSDSTAAQYTYANMGTVISSSTVNSITQAQDTRATGVPSVSYTYHSETGAPAGAVLTTTETTSNTTVSTVATQGSNSQAPQVTYPDSSLYDYTVNAGGLLANVTNTLGAVNSYAYTSNTGSWTTTTTDANSNSVAVTKTTNGKITSRTWPKVGSETVAPTENWYYNAAGYLTSYSDTLGHTITFTRDPVTNLVTKITYPDATTESFTYNSFSEPLTHVRRNGGTEYFAYDSTGLLQTEKDAVGNTTTFTYDANYRIASIKDANNNTTSFLYNDAGKTTKITHPDMTYQSFTYDSAGDLLTKTDELSHTTTYTYDGFKRVLTAKDSIGRVTAYAYAVNSPANASPYLITLPSGKKVAASYQAGWGYNSTSVTTAYGTSSAATTSYGLDAVGNVISVTDALSHETTFGYDARERKAWARDPAGNEAMFYYDDASNLLNQVTPDGTTAITYDSMNRSVQVNDAKNQITKFTYDPEGKVLTYKDPKNNTYISAYDLDERPLSTTFPDSTIQSVTYDPVGNPLTSKTRDGVVQTFSYDTRNRNTGYSWSDGVTPSVTVGFDSASRVTSLSNSNSTLTYTYDNANEVLSENQYVAGLGSKNVSYTYTTDSALGTLTYPDATALTYGYDNVNNVTSIQQGSSSVASFTYDANNNRTAKNLANGVNSTLSYDAVQRLTMIKDLTPSPASGTLLQEFQYGYDSMSRRTYVKRDTALGDVYSYDATDQMTGVKYNCTNPDTTPTNPSETTSYTYDAAGNRTQVVDSLNGTINYTPNNNNQYTVVGGSAATYDGRGNLATLSGTTYTYEAHNLLVSATDSFSNVVTQFYDPLGRCVKRVINGTATYFVYDQSWRTLADYSGAGVMLYRYVYGPTTNELLTRTDSSGNVIYFHSDGLGSITKVTNSAGAVLEQYAYNIFGSVTIKNPTGTVLTNSAFANRFLFAGGEFIPVLGLYNFRYRFYSPVLGRFMQADPKGHAGDQYNIYRYCGNNPNNEIDPSGLNPNDILPSSGGIQFSGSADAGGPTPSGYVAAGGTITWGGGFFWDDFGSGSPTGGLFISSGAFARTPGYSVTLPGQGGFNGAPQTPFSVGANIGMGYGAWFSNAGSVGNLNGPFNQYNVNVEGVNIALGLSFNANGDFTYILSFSLPNLGFAVSGYPTNTVSTDPGGNGSAASPVNATSTQSTSSPTVYEAEQGFNPSTADYSNPNGTVIVCSDGIVVVSPDGTVTVVRYPDGN